MMKNKIILIILLLTSTISLASNLKPFIPQGDKFVALDIKNKQPSINDICNFLGYNSDQFYTYLDLDIKDSKVFIVVFKVFTDDIICVITEDNINSISKTDVQKFLVNFNLKEELGSYEIESILSNGVKNKSLTKEFLSEIFNHNFKSDDETIIAIEIGYELHFLNGILTKYYTTDGLNKWARMWKNELPSTFRKYLNSAKMYSDNQIDIINEINVQADAFSKTPYGVLNEYIKFHSNSDGTINYKMLIVAHYNEVITLSQFKKINIGRYRLTTEFNDTDNYKRTTFRVNKGLYTFDEKGKLVNTYTSE